jgi:hypothetical protein
MMFSVSCYIIIQLAAILILHETKRVKLILTSKNSLEYVVGVKNLQIEKNMLFTLYLISLVFSFARFTIFY